MAHGEVVIDCIYDDCPNPDNHLYLNTNKGLFHCFRCGRGGTISKLKEDYEEQYGESFDWSVDDKRPWRDVDLNEPFSSANEVTQKQKREQSALPDDFHLIQEPDGSVLMRKAIEYLRKRGISLNRARYYELGIGKDTLSGRLVVPIYNETGERIVYYLTRRYLFGRMRYQNPRNEDVPRGKSDVVFNSCRVQTGSVIYLTEGVFDAMRVGPQAVAVLGKELSSAQMRIILGKNPSKVIVALDAEEERGKLDIARSLEPYTSVEIIDLDRGDPGDTTAETKPNFLRSKRESYSFSEEIETILSD